MFQHIFLCTDKQGTALFCKIQDYTSLPDNRLYFQPELLREGGRGLEIIKKVTQLDFKKPHKCHSPTANGNISLIC